MSSLLDFTIKSTVILLCGLVLLRFMRRQSAAGRHALLAIALLCAAAVPAVQWMAPTWRLPVTPVAVTLGSAPDVIMSQRQEQIARAAYAPQSAAQSLPSSYSLSTVIIGSWLAGVFICLFRLAAGLARLGRINSRATPLDERPWIEGLRIVCRAQRLQRTAKLLATRDPSLLFTWGCWHPTVIVPPSARGWSQDRVELVLHHELAHISRGDWVMQVAAELVRAVYWFNPIVWIVCARLRQESEQACDDAVVNRGIDGSVYATHLVEIVRDLQPGSFWLPAPAVARPSSLERRVSAMLDPSLDRRPLSRRAGAAVLAGLLTLTTAIAGVAAQSFASLAGSIVDASDAALPDVTVVLINERSGAKYELRSDSTGRYQFVGLPPSDYRLEARIPGFATFRGRVSIAGQNLQQDLTLEVGALTETVSVSSKDNDAPSPMDLEAARRLEERLKKRAAAKCPAAPATGTARIGGNIRTPAKIRDVRPEYPASLRSAGTEGTVVLRGRIGTEGIIEALEVVSAAHPDLASAAVAAVGQWQFDATLLNCEPIPVTLNVTVNFRQ